MSRSPTIEKMPRRDNAFSRKIAEEVKNLNRCYQCSMCSDGCPVVFAMDYYPNQIIHLVRLGIKEKVLAAHRAGIKKVILPRDNKKDLDEVPQHVKDELEFVFISNIDQALKEVLHPHIK